FRQHILGRAVAAAVNVPVVEGYRRPVQGHRLFMHADDRDLAVTWRQHLEIFQHRFDADGVDIKPGTALLIRIAWLRAKFGKSFVLEILLRWIAGDET